MKKKSVLILILLVALSMTGFPAIKAEEIYPEISVLIYKIEQVDPVEVPMEWTLIDWHYYVTVQDGGLVYEDEKNYTFWYDSNRLMNDLYTYEIRNKVFKLTLTLFDEDYPGTPDQVDISSYPHGGENNNRNRNRTCQFIAYYDVVIDSFVQGDQYEIEDGYYKASGESDGSYYWDENDAILWFKIEDNYHLPVSNPGEDMVVALGEEVSFNGSSSSASEGSVIEKYEWDFNDGLGFRVRPPETSFSFETEGVYTIRMKVTDSMGESNTGKVTVYVGNAPPEASFIYSPSSPSYVDTIHFNDTSVDVDGAVKSWLWNFGDGETSTEQNPNHTYSLKGEYMVNLTVADNKDVVNSAVVPLYVDNMVPYADFSYAPDDPIRDGEIQFYDSSDDYESGVLLYMWDFGDGGNASEMNPVHSFTASGDFGVTLTVEDEDGNVDDRQRTISIVNREPAAAFQIAPLNPSVGQLIQFIDTSTDPENGNLTYEWKLGDGQFEYTSNPTHTYMATGTYNVKLTVTDDEGLTSSTTFGVLVIRKYDLVIEVKDILGLPITGSEVTVYKSGDYFTRRDTDSQGRFTLYDIPEGNYRVVAKNLMLESDKYITVDRDSTETVTVMLSIISGGLTGGILVLAVVLFLSKDKIMKAFKKS